MYQRLSTQTDPYIAFRISDSLTTEEFNQITETLESEISNHGKLKMLVEFDHMKFPRPGVMWEDLKFVYHHARDFERFAVLGDKNWEKWWAEIADKMFDTDCRFFGTAERDQAWEWIKH